MRDKTHAWWELHRFEAIVFVTGMAILIIEVTATRILSPYYGNTIYTVSSVIGVILGALSLGYYVGGALADESSKADKMDKFYGIIVKSGISLLVLFILVEAILPIGGNFFGLQFGPLIWSVILFFPSSYLMGKLSPFAITLAKADSPETGLGHITGGIFFWSTAGSIAGSLLAGFVLIPHLGVRSILVLTTIVVLVLGQGGRILGEKNKQKRMSHIFTLIFILLALLASFYTFERYKMPGTVFTYDGVYERITVRDDLYAGKPVRFFMQDRSISGGMFLESDKLVFDYTKYIELFKLANPSPAHALFIGGGVYSMPKALHAESPNTEIDVVDIEPDLEHIAKTYFRLPETPKIATHVGDGRRYLKDSTTAYDLIFSDVYYSLYSIPSHFTTHEFFALARERLAPNGIFIANVIGGIDDTKDSFLFSEIHTMQQVFPHMEVLAVESTTTLKAQNFILVGWNGTTTIAGISERLATTEDPTLKNIQEHLFRLAEYNITSHETFSDDFAPVEHLVGKLISKLRIEDENADILLPATNFSGANALHNVSEIVALGSRAIGTVGHGILAGVITQEMKTLGADVTLEHEQYVREDRVVLPLMNIIAKFQPENTHRILIGTHYDSIARAYRDKKYPNGLMPGANNGASGVATMLELARSLAQSATRAPIGVDLVFFDGEEGQYSLGAGDPAWFPLGSGFFARNIKTYYPQRLPDTGIILDMVCDQDLTFYPERTSLEAAPAQLKGLWNVGRKIAPNVFKNEEGQNIGDDHLALNTVGIPSILLADLLYEPWWNTTEDTPDKCSEKSLEAVGKTLEAYVRSR